MDDQHGMDVIRYYCVFSNSSLNGPDWTDTLFAKRVLLRKLARKYPLGWQVDRKSCHFLAKLWIQNLFNTLWDFLHLFYELKISEILQNLLYNITDTVTSLRITIFSRLLLNQYMTCLQFYLKIIIVLIQTSFEMV